MADEAMYQAPWWRRLLCAFSLCGGGYEHVGRNVYRCRFCGGLSNGQVDG